MSATPMFVFAETTNNPTPEVAETTEVQLPEDNSNQVETQTNHSTITSINPNKTGTADLSEMGLNHFSKFTHISQVFKVIMQFLGGTIILAAVIGGMIGGTMLIISAGNENLAERGKNILVASAIGLVITLLAYLGVTLVQQILYSI